MLRRVIFMALFFVSAAALIAAGTAPGRGMVGRVGEDWIICSTLESAQRLSIYVKNGDQSGWDGILRHGLGVPVGQGTKVTIVDIESRYLEVRIVDRVNSGYLGWISSDLLVFSQ